MAWQNEGVEGTLGKLLSEGMANLVLEDLWEVLPADLLLEIGCEELPASFVHGALKAMPDLVRSTLANLRLSHGAVHVYGTPRRLALMVNQLQTEQDDLEEEVTGPPVKAAFKDGQPTRAAEAFAKKLGCSVDALERIDTPKGEYLRGARKEQGRPAKELLPDALVALAGKIPFRKSMRWGSGTRLAGSSAAEPSSNRIERERKSPSTSS